MRVAKNILMWVVGVPVMILLLAGFTVFIFLASIEDYLNEKSRKYREFKRHIKQGG